MILPDFLGETQKIDTYPNLTTEELSQKFDQYLGYAAEMDLMPRALSEVGMVVDALYTELSKRSIDEISSKLDALTDSVRG